MSGRVLYTYVGNDPLNKTDPTGRCEYPIVECSEKVGGGRSDSGGDSSKSIEKTANVVDTVRVAAATTGIAASVAGTGTGAKTVLQSAAAVSEKLGKIGTGLTVAKAAVELVSGKATDAAKTVTAAVVNRGVGLGTTLIAAAAVAQPEALLIGAVAEISATLGHVGDAVAAPVIDTLANAPASAGGSATGAGISCYAMGGGC